MMRQERYPGLTDKHKVISIIKIVPQMFADVYDAILCEWNPGISRERWQAAFTSRWVRDEDHLGYALTDGGRIVGILGMLFSHRPIDGRMVRFCNLHAWYVKPKHRANSLLLLKPLLSLKQYVVTDFTASPTVAAVMRRMGFLTLDPTIVLLPPIPSHRTSTHCELSELDSWHVNEDSPLNHIDRQIFLDHQGIDCGHLLARARNDYCYVVYSRIVQHNLPYCLVHYVSNPRLLAEQHLAIRRYLLRNSRSRYVAVEARLLHDSRIPLSFGVRGRDRVYRSHSPEISARQIDTLYSEIVLLKHSLLLPLRQRLITPVKRVIPFKLRQYVRMGAGLIAPRCERRNSATPSRHLR